MQPLSRDFLISFSLSLAALLGFQLFCFAPTQAASKPNFEKIDLLESKASNEEERIFFDGDDVSYDDASKSFKIKGHAVIRIPSKELEIRADEVDYLEAESTITANGNVVLKDKDQIGISDSFTLNVETTTANFQELEAYSDSGYVEAEEGSFHKDSSGTFASFQVGSTKLPAIVSLRTPLVGSFASPGLLRGSANDLSTILQKGQSFSIRANQIIYDQQKIQNNLTVKGLKLKFRDLPITVPIPYALLTAGDSSQQMFGFVLGNTPRTGAGDFNLGPKLSFVLGDPAKERAISFAPFGQFNSALGLGAMLQYTDPRGSALLGYGSAKRRGVAEVQVHLNKHTNFIYGWNSYFNGGITKQLAQLNFNYLVPLPFLGAALEGSGVQIFSNVSYILDSQGLRDRENNRLSDLQRNALGTQSDAPDRGALRVEQSFALTSRPLLDFGTDRYNAKLRLSSFSTLRGYSTGNLNAFTTFGPAIEVNLDRFANIDFGVNRLLIGGRSPLGFDQVIQGNTSFFANGDFRLSKWLSIGGGAVYSVNRKDFIDQQIRLTFGADDFRLIAAYNPVRRQFNFGFSILLADKLEFNRFDYRQPSGRKKRF